MPQVPLLYMRNHEFKCELYKFWAHHYELQLFLCVVPTYNFEL